MITAAVIKRRLILAASCLVLLAGACIVTPAVASAAGYSFFAGIDSGAKDKFENSVSQTGGSEASSLPAVVGSAINILLYVAGVIAVIIIVVGGLRFVTSEGDAQAASRAKNAVVYACVGLVLAALAYAIVNFVLRGLT